MPDQSAVLRHSVPPRREAIYMVYLYIRNTISAGEATGGCGEIRLRRVKYLRCEIRLAAHEINCVCNSLRGAKLRLYDTVQIKPACRERRPDAPARPQGEILMRYGASECRDAIPYKIFTAHMKTPPAVCSRRGLLCHCSVLRFDFYARE